MRRWAAYLLLAALALGLAVLVSSQERPAVPVAGPVYGLSGEQPASFADPRYRALGLRRARVQVSWDLYYHEPMEGLAGLADEQRRLRAWFAVARAAGVREVLLAVKSSRDLHRLLPDPATYRRAVRQTLAVIDRQGYGEMITSISPWNEPDLQQATAEHPEQAGLYYRVIAELCRQRGCQALAGDFSDGHLRDEYLRRYLSAAGPAPRWGWHAYRDGQARRLTRLERFLDQLPPMAQVVLTEQGGILYQRGQVPRRAAVAAADLEYLLEATRQIPQVRAFYVYQWQGERPPRWDSGLISPDGATRRSYCVFARRLQAQAALAGYC